MVELLKTNICKVTFKKADGSLRDMTCTLKAENILVESAGETKPKEDVLVVWDMEKEAWRSFRLDRLITGPIPV